MAAAKSPPVADTGTGTWESEGGALSSHNPAILPDGVTAIPVTNYRVGPYTYSNLVDAMAEHHRQNSKVAAENGEHVSRN